METLTRSEALWYLGGQLDAYVDIRVPKILVVSFPRSHGPQQHGYELLKKWFPQATFSDNKVDVRWILRGKAASDFCAELRHFCYPQRAAVELAAAVPSHTRNPAGLYPVKSVNKTTNEVVCFDSDRAAAVATGIKLNQIQAALSGRQKTSGGYEWSYTVPRDNWQAAKESRQNADPELKRLRDEVPVTSIAANRPTAYYAGLFEHHGEILPNNGSLLLVLNHKHETVCQALCDEFGGSVARVPRSRKSLFVWRLQDTAAARQALQSLQPYLLHRGDQAVAAVADSLITPTTVCFNDLLSMLNTNNENIVDWNKVSEEARWWIGGQLDGNGCSYVDPNALQLRVIVVQPQSRWGCLHILQETLGGEVTDACQSDSKYQCTREWTVTDQPAKLFCKIIQDYCFRKRSQLKLAATFPANELQVAKCWPVVSTDVITASRNVYCTSVDTESNNVAAARRGERYTAASCTWSNISNPLNATQIYALYAC